jgi:uncharacterized membrane protein YedE/YeeE
MADDPGSRTGGGGLLLAAGALVAGPPLLAAWTGYLAWLAVPVGFLLGFVLQKGDLCGASAMSEAVLFRDRRKLFGLWVAVVASMVVFATLDLLGLAKPDPKPLRWLSMGAGGFVFGIGTVLAGGCVSGCLYKAGAGNVNSMAAIAGIPIGVGLVEAGPLAALNRAMRGIVVSGPGGRPVTVGSLFGVPFWVVASACAAATIGWVVAVRRRRPPASPAARACPGLRRPWRPWVAGLAVGVVGGLGWLSSAAIGRNYPLGVTHGPYHAAVIALSGSPQPAWLVKASIPATCSPEDALRMDVAVRPEVVWWLVGLVASLVAGSFVSARLGGRAKLLPRPPEQTVIAFFGGIVVGMGAGVANGCVIGNIVSGLGLASVGAAVFAAATFLGNRLATRLYLMGR